ncbi:hypothetical protein EIP91_009775 [Steccherinum ochraceum]|uniref:Uncharacterized protein n=1 Tax=Steccherinum ochraceum TaxID=92696 RepID=A0A4R0R9A2_9APHY|nr:hypothetical protein EIP91_009775 [Steccherinum ochraceum]
MPRPKLSTFLKGDYARIAEKLETVPRQTISDDAEPADLLEFGLANAELASAKGGVPIMSYGYMLTYGWLYDFVVKHKLYPNSGRQPSETASDDAKFEFVSRAARHIQRNVLDQVAPQLHACIPGSQTEVILLSVGHNLHQEGLDDAKDLQRRDLLMATLRMKQGQEPRWFIAMYDF